MLSKSSKLAKAKYCFLDIGPESYFRLMSLDFGMEKGWTESNFVLIDGNLADFQPRSQFEVEKT